MKEIEFTRDGVALREEVEAFGESNIEEISVDYNELDEFEVEIDTNGKVLLDSLIDVQHGSGGDIASLTVRFDRAPSVQAKAQRRQSSQEGDELPPVPDVDVSDEDVGGRRTFYKRMREKPESQPAKIRQIIYENQDEDNELKRKEFEDLIQGKYPPDSGGVSMSLVVLEYVTEEIEREGRGKDQTIRWVGSTTN